MIVTIGEAVYDIIFKDGIPVSSVFGGSMYNVAVSIGRSGTNVSFAGFYANDRIGEASRKFLNDNNVDTSYFSPIVGAKSNLALAFLNEKGVPSYSFYRDEKLNGKSLEMDFSDVSVLLVGSFYSINNKNCDHVISIIKRAKENNVVVAYDPNIRNHDVFSDNELLGRVRKIMSLSDFVKMSDEDANHITGANKPADWHSFMQSAGVKRYVITQGEKFVIAIYDGIESQINVPQVEVVSSVGAGDATNAGIIAKGSMFLDSQKEFLKAVERGVKFGSHVCTLSENFISKGFKTE
jgi:sugar/nucleoside kinase (ribokinase family)